jgi:hypothetical protein
MKKIAAILLFALSSSLFTFCKAQDTIVFKTGDKLGVKIISVGEQVSCITTQGNMILSIDQAKIQYIKYQDGSRYTVKQASAMYRNLPGNSSSLHENDQTGQLVINIGAGYSPVFDGQVGFVGLFFPVSKNFEYFTCSSITPNMGAIIDYGLDNKMSVGVAASYQSEIITPDEDYFYTDKITRINLAVRLLDHLNKRNTNFDNYIGMRIGSSYWEDTPSLLSKYQNVSGSAPVIYFLSNPNSWVPSFQFVYGMRIYPSDYFGFHFELGIGSPYLMEGGITYRINPPKAK